MTEKKKIPPELAQLDLMLCQKLNSEGAPQKVLDAWQAFLDSVVEWKG